MNLSKKLNIFIFALLIFVGLISWRSYFKVYKQEDTVDIHTFPEKIAEWTAENLLITEEEYEILETRNAFAREYSHPDGRKLTLFIVYSQNNRKVSHPPEICYTGGGVTVVAKKQISLNITNETDKICLVNQLVLEQGNYKQLSFYWFKVGDLFTANYWKQQWLIAWKSLLGQPSGSALIRISLSVDSADPDTQQYKRSVQEFFGHIYPHLHTYLP